MSKVQQSIPQSDFFATYSQTKQLSDERTKLTADEVMLQVTAGLYLL